MYTGIAGKGDRVPALFFSVLTQLEGTTPSTANTLPTEAIPGYAYMAHDDDIGNTCRQGQAGSGVPEFFGFFLMLTRLAENGEGTTLPTLF